MNDEARDRFLQKSIALAVENVRSGKGGPFGALIVQGETIVGEGANLVTSMNDPTAHAEVLAIREAATSLGSFELVDCVLFTSCEPCPMCLGAIYWARLDQVYFAATRLEAAAAGFDDERIYSEVPLDPAERSLPMCHVSLPEANRAFEEWNRSASKIRY